MSRETRPATSGERVRDPSDLRPAPSRRLLILTGVVVPIMVAFLGWGPPLIAEFTRARPPAPTVSPTTATDPPDGQPMPLPPPPPAGPTAERSETPPVTPGEESTASTRPPTSDTGQPVPTPAPGTGTGCGPPGLALPRYSAEPFLITIDPGCAPADALQRWVVVELPAADESSPAPEFYLLWKVEGVEPYTVSSAEARPNRLRTFFVIEITDALYDQLEQTKRVGDGMLADLAGALVVSDRYDNSR